MREALTLPVDDKVDFALTIKVDIFRPMSSDASKAKALDQSSERGPVDVADGEFDKVDAFDIGRSRQGLQVGEGLFAAHDARLVQRLAQGAQ
jgi:hypothetical protein